MSGTVTSPLEQAPDANPPGPVAVSWPPESFLWSIIDGPMTTAGPVPPGLQPDLEEDLPQHDVHAVAAPTRDGRLLVCAARRQDLRQLDSQVVRLTPSTLPPFANGLASPIEFNLLTGEFEPVLLKERRQRGSILASALVLTLASLVALGLLRRVEHAQAVALTYDLATADVVRGALGDQHDPGALSMALVRQRERVESGSAVERPLDATSTLTRVLAALPIDPDVAKSAKVQSIAIDPAAVNLAVTVEGDAAPWLRALRVPEDWSMDEPRLAAADKITRVNLTLKPRAAPRPGQDQPEDGGVQQGRAR